MITLLQRVCSSRIEIENQTVAEISRGILVFVGVQAEDDIHTAKTIATRIINYRIFPDEDDKMNLSLLDIHGDLLLVPQFTLAADTNRGRRPSFTSAAPPEHGEKIFNLVVEAAGNQYNKVQLGIFAADMKVHLVNDGPVTFIL